jgi:molybdenum cofactor cytidylyltransferase
MPHHILNPVILLLAAGMSRRLGRPKQLLDFGGESLLKRTATRALQSKIGAVYVVTGAEKNKIDMELAGLQVERIENKEWEEGMASSIRTGLLAAITKNPSTDGILIMVCDQPEVTSGMLQKLMTLQADSGAAIAASAYGGISGTPAVFHSSLFHELMSLRGDTGARKIMQIHNADLVQLPFEAGAQDIDTESDYLNWMIQAKQQQA